MQIRACNNTKSIMRGKRVPLEVELSDTLATIKSKIEEKEAIPANDQSLTLHLGDGVSHELDDDNRTIADYPELYENPRSLLLIYLKYSGGFFSSYRFNTESKELGLKNNVKKMICRKCYGRLPIGAANCRKRKCGHTNQLRPKKYWFRWW